MPTIPLDIPSERFQDFRAGFLKMRPLPPDDNPVTGAPWVLEDFPQHFKNFLRQQAFRVYKAGAIQLHIDAAGQATVHNDVIS